MKVKCILAYHDTKLKRRVEVDEELDVTEERANQLIIAQVATPTTEKVVKKRASKKEV